MDRYEPSENAPTWQMPDPSAPPPAGAGQVTPPSPPVAWGRQMKHRNPFLAWFVWPLVTIGIYHLVWYYKIHREMHDFDTRRNVPTAGPVLVLIFLFWTIVAPLVSYYNCGKRIADTQRAAGLVPSVSPGLGTLLMVISGVGTLYYQMELNKVVAVYGDAAPGSTVPLAA